MIATANADEAATAPVASSREELHAALDRVLTRAVMLATGNDDAQPRPGQRMLAHDILDSMIGEGNLDTWSRGHVAGNAPTGVGKSFVVLAAAIVVAVLRGERSVISTEQLGLQSQYLHKDAPVACRAAELELGRAPKIAVYKGWSNSVCGSRAASTASEILGIDAEHPSKVAVAIEGLDSLIAAQQPPPRTATSRPGRRSAGERAYKVDGREVTHSSLPMVRWALNQVAQAEDGVDVPGDKQSFEGVDPDRTWQLLSTSPDACLGVGKCAFGSSCRPAEAKQKATEADIIITNHSMLAVQAALGVPVVLGSRKLGVFRHLIVDEAHALPGQVRAQGARKLDAYRIQRICKSTTSLLDPQVEDPQGKKVIAANSDGMNMAAMLDHRLSTIAAKADKSGVVKMTEADFPLDGLDEMLTDWLKKVKRFYPSEEGMIAARDILAVRRANNLIDSLLSDIKDAAAYERGVARWVESPTGERNKFAGQFTGVSLNTSPVEIGGKLHANLYTADVPALDGEDYADVDPEAARLGWQLPPSQWLKPVLEAGEVPRHDLSVSMVSATLPRGFTFEMGLRTRIKDYPSPFDAAYARSAFHAPRLRDQADLDAVMSTRWGGKAKFDTELFARWVAVQAPDYIEANQGSTLFLAAKADHGRLYVETLRRRLGSRYHIYSQWDGEQIPQIIQAWKSDHHSVLVGTKSLMTGVDAPGQTNSLVIIDRPPRAGANPVDDSRTELVMERQEIDKWAAERQTYIADAAALMEQEAGRLVRALSDFGMVICFDPRLIKSNSMAYPESTRKVYIEAFRRFERKLSSKDEALAFLRASAQSSLHLAG